jgi:signal transduction histidine kinase
MKWQSLQAVLVVRLSMAVVALMLIGFASFLWHLTGDNQGTSLVVQEVLKGFLLHAGWTFPLPLGAALTVLSATLIVRQSLAPLRDLAARAKAIRPGAPLQKLTDPMLPAELVPLVAAFDEAAARLDGALATQKRFTANAAHELRTPLTVLSGRLDRLAESGLAAEDIRKLQADCARMARVVTQLTALVRAEGGLEIPEACTALAPLLREVASGLAPLAASRDVTIGVEIEAEWVMARGSPEAIEPMLRNVIENAVLHSPPGTEVAIRLGTDMVVSVEDAGPGIPGALREQVFERFWRGSWSRHEGSGLGLAIVKEAGARVGATLWLEEAPTGGARVAMRFQAA